jgi:hypothetical protein
VQVAHGALDLERARVQPLEGRAHVLRPVLAHGDQVPLGGEAEHTGTVGRQAGGGLHRPGRGVEAHHLAVLEGHHQTRPVGGEEQVAGHVVEVVLLQHRPGVDQAAGGGVPHRHP